MRNNQPTTGHAYTLQPDQALVSVTDRKGRITYCNLDFMEASGYSREELLGQPHNIVRHPDMPEEAFRDMWETIQAQQPWSGLVKNRRKNGDYYWVQANATPMMDGDQLTGFLSVRTAPRQQDVLRADALYTQMRADEQARRQRYALRRGAVIRLDPLGRLVQWLSAGVLGQLALVQLAGFAGVAASIEYGLNIYCVAALITLATALMVWWAWLLTLKPLRGLVVDANRLAAGDLTHRIVGGGVGLIGQLQKALTQMTVNLRTVVKDVRCEVENLTHSMCEIADGNQDLSSRTESQASSLQQTAASMEEINGSIQQNALSTELGAGLARETAAITTRSNDAVLTLATTMQGVAASSARIGEIIQLIEGVAFQTNILALNAAVEAARAGDQGRGFAVVASEVRSLARRASDAAKEITHLIEDAVEQVETGNSQTQQARTCMQDALAAAGNVCKLLAEVSASASEQRSGVAQINEAVAHMDSITQQNAAMVEELAAAAKSVQSQVESVSNLMRLFRLRSGEMTLSQLDAVELRKEYKQFAGVAA